MNCYGLKDNPISILNSDEEEKEAAENVPGSIDDDTDTVMTGLMSLIGSNAKSIKAKLEKEIEKNILNSNRKTFEKQELLRKMLNKAAGKYEYVKQEGEKDTAKNKNKKASSGKGKTDPKA